MRPSSILTSAQILLVAVAMIGLGGCAFMSDEDRDFYGKGWVNPRDLDRQPMHHPIPNPEAPADASQAPTATAATTPSGTHPSSESDEWTAPPLN